MDDYNDDQARVDDDIEIDPFDKKIERNIRDEAIDDNNEPDDVIDENDIDEDDDDEDDDDIVDEELDIEDQEDENSPVFLSTERKESDIVDKLNTKIIPNSKASDKRRKSNAKAVECIDEFGNIVAKYRSGTEAAHAIGVLHGDISLVCRGLKDNIKGYRFRFEGEEWQKRVTKSVRKKLSIQLETTLEIDERLSTRQSKFRTERDKVKDTSMEIADSDKEIRV